MAVSGAADSPFCTESNLQDSLGSTSVIPFLATQGTSFSKAPNSQNCLLTASLTPLLGASNSLQSTKANFTDSLPNSSKLSHVAHFFPAVIKKCQTTQSVVGIYANHASKRKLEELSLQQETTKRCKKLSLATRSKGTQTRKSNFCCKLKDHIIKQLRKRIFYYKKKLATQSDKINKMKQSESPLTLENWQKLTKCQTDFIKMQVTGINIKNTKGLRYTDSQKRLSLTMYYQNYEHLRSIFTLPNSKTLSTFVETSKIKIGINDFYLHLLGQKLFEFKYDNRCMLTFDGMTIAQALQYDIKSDSIIGFSDFGDTRRTNTMANQIIVFMLRGLRRNWKQPIAFYFNKGNLSDSF
jgi:hypothetical protein